MNKQNKVKQAPKLGTALGFTAEAGLGLPIVRSSGFSRKGNRYIPYTANSQRIASNNNLPQLLIKIALESPTHGAAVQRKAMMIEGLGVDLSKLSPALVKKLENSLNDKGETLNDIHEKVSQDYAHFNGYAIKVYWGNDGYIARLEHVPFEQVRKGEPIGDLQYYIISNNWDDTLSTRYEKTYQLPAFNTKYFGKGSIPVNELGIPTPTQEQVEQGCQLIYVYDYKPSASSGQLFYPLPDYWSGIDAALTETEIAIANKSLIDNGFNGKYLVTLPYVPTTEEEKAELDKLLLMNYGGAANQGKIMTLYVNDQNSMPQLNKIEPIEADTYLNVDKSVKQAIVTAHQIPAILLEYNEGGGFNNRAEEMTVAFNQYQNSKIKQLQAKLARTYKTIMYYMGWDEEDVQIIPFSLDSMQKEQIDGETSLNA